MVEVQYFGRTGNQLFQYCLGRIIASRLGYHLRANPVWDFPSTYNVLEGNKYEEPIQHVFEKAGHEVHFKAWRSPITHRANMDSILNDPSPRRIFVRGFFESFHYYEPYLNEIRSEWIVPDPEVKVEQRHPDDFILHVRRGDKKETETPSVDYYHHLLSTVQFRELFIVTDFPADPFFNELKQFRPVMLSSADSGHGAPRNMIQEFKTIMSFNKISLSCGTFGWWAALLSDAAEIYYPVTQDFGIDTGPLSRKAMRVPQERYYYVGRRGLLHHQHTTDN